MEADVQFNENNVFVAYFQPPMLQAMASYSIARAVVRHVVSHLPTKASLYQILHENHHDELFECVKMPRLIQVIVKEGLNQVCNELRNLLTYFARYCSISKLYPVELPNINCCIWFANGKINFKKTVEQILSNCELSQPQKFILMSQLCMVDEIKTIYASSLPENFVNIKVYPYAANLTSYWLYHQNNALDADSIDINMAARFEKNWPAFLYFFNRLDAEDQIRLIIDSNSIKQDFDFSERSLQILSMMSPFHQHCVVSRLPEKMVRNCCINMNSSNCAFRVWENLKNIITDKKFDEIVLDVLTRVWHIEERMDMLIAIWKTGSDHQRNYVMETSAQPILRYFFPNSQRCYSGIPCAKAFHFLSLIISQKDAEFRKRRIFRYASQFGSSLDPSSKYSEIIKFCLPALDDQLRFKKIVANSEEMNYSCNELMTRSSYDILIAKLRFYLPDEANLREYVKQWLPTRKLLSRRTYSATWGSKWHEFSSFIDELYLDPGQATELKKSFVSSFIDQLAKYYHNDVVLEGALKIVEFELVDDELAIFKRNFAHALAACFRSKKLIYYNNASEMRHQIRANLLYGPKYFIKNVHWCCNYDQIAIEEFQNQILSVDEVFDKFFKEFAHSITGHYTHTTFKCIIGDLNDYLRWYMPNDQERKEYKMARIDESEDFDPFYEAITRKRHFSHESGNFLQIILCWCCDDDQKAINELKSRHPELDHSRWR